MKKAIRLFFGSKNRAIATLVGILILWVLKTYNPEGLRSLIDGALTIGLGIGIPYAIYRVLLKPMIPNFRRKKRRRS